MTGRRAGLQVWRRREDVDVDVDGLCIDGYSVSHNLWSTEHSGHHVYTGGPAGGCAGYWQPAPSGDYDWYPNVPSDSYAVTFNLVLDAARTRHGPSYGADAFNISSSRGMCSQG